MDEDTAEQVGRRFGSDPIASPRAYRWGRRRPLAHEQRTETEWVEAAKVTGNGSNRSLSANHRYRRLLGLADVVAALVALVVSLPLLGRGDKVSLAAVAGLPLVIVLSKVMGLYDRDELVLRKSTLEEAPKLFQLATIFALVAAVSRHPLGLGDIGGDQLLGLWGTMFVALIGTRVIARGLARRTTAAERCLLLGDHSACKRARAKIEDSRKVNAHVVAEITSARIGEEEVPVAMLAQMAAEHDIQRVIIAPRSTDHGDVLNLVRAVKAMGLNVSVLPRLLEVVGSSVIVDDIEGLRILGVTRFGLTRSSRVIKRGFDILASGVGLTLISPLMLGLAIAVKLGSQGPVLFRQPRIGKTGGKFDMLKFRSMVDGADAMKDDLRGLNEAPGLFKIADDPRITRVGRLLRRTSLDELPQLFNVLRGEMSLVGPRPLVDEEDARILGWDRHRLHLTPGMTGPWQVLGSARIPLDEMVKLDYLYVATWSLWADTKILLRTVAFVLGREGM